MRIGDNANWPVNAPPSPNRVSMGMRIGRSNHIIRQYACTNVVAMQQQRAKMDSQTAASDLFSPLVFPTHACTFRGDQLAHISQSVCIRLVVFQCED